MPVPDPFRQGLERGWITHDASRLEHDLFLEADIAVIGSGAGGMTLRDSIEALLRDHAEPKVDVLLCPPATLISAMAGLSRADRSE